MNVCFDSDYRKFVAKNVKGLNKKNKNQVDLLSLSIIIILINYFLLQNSPLSMTEEVKNTLLSLASAPEGLYDLAILIQVRIFL